MKQISGERLQDHWSSGVYTLTCWLDPKAHRFQHIVYLCSDVHCRLVSQIFSETAWPIKAEVHMEHPWEEGMEVYINRPGHTTKIATMPIYSKT